MVAKNPNISPQFLRTKTEYIRYNRDGQIKGPCSLSQFARIHIRASLGPMGGVSRGDSSLNPLIDRNIILCQILARALGGKVARAVSGWDIGVRTINFSLSAKTFTNLGIPTTLSLIECHRDEVYELPSNVEVLAWSDKTQVEMFKCGDHIMGVQGHPEYTRDILLHLIDRLLQRNLIEESYAVKARANMKEKEPDREAWKELCTSFLKGRKRDMN
ncbi:gamma-glutamyl peptidase 5-like protein [Tanacetum coccineum]